MIKLNTLHIKLIQLERAIPDSELARMAGVSRAEIFYAKSERRNVNTSFIEGMLKAFPGLRFEDLFIIE